MPELTIKRPNALLGVERRDITESQAEMVLAFADGLIEINNDNEPTFRGDPPQSNGLPSWRNMAYDYGLSFRDFSDFDDFIEAQAQAIDKLAHPDSEWARERREGVR